MRSLMKTANTVSSLLAALLLLSTSFTPALGSPTDLGLDGLRDNDGEEPIEFIDDRLLVTLAPHTDRERAKQDFVRFAHVTAVEDIHFNQEDYSIFVLTPLPGQRERTFSIIQRMRLNHPEIVNVDRHFSLGSGEQLSTPDDQNFSEQWPLTNMRWTQAYQTYGLSQTNPAFLVILGGVPRTVANELGANITEYDARTSTVTQVSPIQPANSVECDIDSSVSGAVTNNKTMIAGAASFQSSMPCNIVVFDVLVKDKKGKLAASNVAVSRAIKHIVNNFTVSNYGYFPVNISFNSHHWYTSKTIQKLGTSLIKNGDLLVMAAGDKPKNTQRNLPTGSIAVVQATNQKNNAFFLIRVQNDPIAAPGSGQPAIINGVVNSTHEGSSFAAPLWCSCIAILISIVPNLTACQASQILLNTGTAVPGSEFKGVITPQWKAYIPALDKAINAALNQTAPSCPL